MGLIVGNGTSGSEAYADRLKLATGTSDPGSAEAGDMYLKTDDKKIRWYDGTNWHDLAAGAGTATGGNSATYTSGNGVSYKIHWWTSSGSFTVAGANIDCDIFVLGGGGSGGGGSGSNYGSGGGAGGILWRPGKTLAPATYTCSIGNGGSWPSGSTTGNKGGDTTFTGNGYTITGNGGGAGSGWANTTQPAACTGGCGGGAGRDAGNQAAGASNQNNSQDASAYAYGYAGGIATGTGCTSAGGGGGTAQVGQNGCYDCNTNRGGTCSQGGDGISTLSGVNSTEFSHMMWNAGKQGTNNSRTNGLGNPVANLSSRPATILIAGGGGGAYEHSSVSEMPYGGKGGGGRGGSRYPNGGGIAGTHAISNTGSGGGAGQKYNGGGDGGNGASGLIIVRYVA